MNRTDKFYVWGIFSLVCLVVFIFAGAECLGEEAVGPQLQKVSVNVLAGNSQGSGTIFLSKVILDDPRQPPPRPYDLYSPALPPGIAMKQAAFIITANHVVDGLREVQSIVGPDGITIKTIRYGDAQIIQEQVELGRTIGEVKYDAKIISVDPRRDIALLRVRKGDFTDTGGVFYLGGLPVAGAEIYHCGAPGGKETGGTCTLTSGIISRIGVRIPGFGGGSELGVFDQTDTAALGGSSGGLIALKSNGQWIGMITLGLGGGDNFHWYVPVRAVRDWAEEVGVMWLLDPSLDRPTEGDIEGIPIELNGRK